MDPLAQLQDIVLPEQVGQWPLAYGWWILISLVLLSFVLIVVWQIKRYRARQIQKQATAAVRSAQTEEDVIKILKWAAMTSFSRAELASQSGSVLKQALKDLLAENKQNEFETLAGFDWQSYYQATRENNTDKLKLAALYWLKHALPATRKSDDLNFSTQEAK